MVLANPTHMLTSTTPVEHPQEHDECKKEQAKAVGLGDTRLDCALIQKFSKLIAGINGVLLAGICVGCRIQCTLMLGL